MWGKERTGINLRFEFKIISENIHSFRRRMHNKIISIPISISNWPNLINRPKKPVSHRGT